jgi:nucleotide-binding universal stress UspA family protein
MSLSMLKTILAAVDASPRAQSVLDAAADLGSRYQATVILLRIVSVPPEFPPAAPGYPDDLGPALQQSARESLEALASGRPGVTIAPPLLFAGQPWRAIVEEGKRLGADLIVIGSHGYSGWDRILGTTASKVADHADRNVLVVHERR